jgi:hypothetical protein
LPARAISVRRRRGGRGRAHLFAQARRDAFARVVGQDPLSIDVEPAQLAVSLVNRYHAVKRAGLL